MKIQKMSKRVGAGIILLLPKENKSLIRGVALFALCGFASLWGIDLRAGNSKPVQFAIMGDRTGGHEPGVFESILKQVEARYPDFIMTIGDMIEGVTQDTVLLKKQWDEYLSIISGLTIPIHHTPGNHDAWYDIMEVWYRRVIGEPCTSFRYESVHFIVFDNSRWPNEADLPKDRLEWLQNEMAKAADADLQLVFMHIPYWFSSIGEGKPDTLHELFKRNGIDAVFTGHYHHYFSGSYDGILYTSIGTSGGTPSFDPTRLLGHHYVWVTIDDQKIQINPVTSDSTYAWDVITRNDLNVVYGLKDNAIKIQREIWLKEHLVIADEHIDVTVSNRNTNIVQSDTLRWESARGWEVTPPQAIFFLQPNEQTSFKFTLNCTDNLFAPPVLRTQLRFNEKSRMAIEEPVRVRRLITCRRISETPSLDGQVNEEAWGDAVTTFFQSDTTSAPAEATRFYFCHDSLRLYAAAVCQESEVEQIRSNCKKHDDIVPGSDDCVGFFFVPDLEPPGAVYKIYVNSIGVILDEVFAFDKDRLTGYDKNWNADAVVKTHVGKDYWSLEMSLPFKALKVADILGDGDWQIPGEWRVNFRRKQIHNNAVADWQPPIGYDPRLYGVMIIE